MARPKSFQLENKVLKNKLGQIYDFLYDLTWDEDTHTENCASEPWRRSASDYAKGHPECDCINSTIREAKIWLESNPKNIDDQMLLPIK